MLRTNHPPVRNKIDLSDLGSGVKKKDWDCPWLNSKEWSTRSETRSPPSPRKSSSKERPRELSEGHSAKPAPRGTNLIRPGFLPTGSCQTEEAYNG